MNISDLMFDRETSESNKLQTLSLSQSPAETISTGSGSGGGGGGGTNSSSSSVSCNVTFILPESKGDSNRLQKNTKRAYETQVREEQSFLRR